MHQLIASKRQTREDLIHTALKALDFMGARPLATLHPPGSIAFVPTISHLNPQATPGDFQLSAEDWDVLFEAIQWRLAKTVAVALASYPAKQADDVVGEIQVVVLECVAALEQLHMALTQERMHMDSTH